MLGHAAVVVCNRFPVLLQPAPLLLGPNEAAKALLQAFREVDIHAPRFIEKFDIDEQIDGALLCPSGTHQGFSLSYARAAGADDQQAGG